MLSRCIFLFISFVSIGLFAQNSKSFDEYLDKGQLYYDNRKIDSAKLFIKKLDSLAVLYPSDSSKYYRLQMLKSSILMSENKKGEAITSLLKSQSFFKKTADYKSLVLNLYKLGVANYYVNRRDIAGKYFEEALEYPDHISKRLKTRILQNFGTINLEIGMSAVKKDTSLIFKAVKSYEKAIQIFRDEGWFMEEALATSLLAECYNQLSDFDTALPIINRAVELAKKANNQSQVGFALIKKTSILGGKNRYKEALETIEKAKPIFSELKDYQTLLYALLEQKKIHIGLKGFEEATVVGDSIYSVSIRAYDTRFADKVSEMDAKYKTAEQAAQLLDQKLQIQNRNVVVLIVISILIIILIISIGLYKRQQFKRMQLQKELVLKESLVKITTQNRLQEQRLEISRDLHDNIGSQLTFIISSIDNLKYTSKDINEKLKEKLANISSFTFDTIHQLRDTIWAMNKNEITLEEFYGRILSYIEKVKSVKSDLQFDIANGISKEVLFSSVEGMNLFRVIQESINNSIKHSNANHMMIKFQEEGNSLKFIISDDGSGFDISSVKTGNGLSNMEIRASQIGGKILIHSQEGKGTEITLTLKR